jgi:hypothetical protein
MKLGVMQPYFFPYLGYFQLVCAVDKFIAYDDVNFIKQGWINRNNILCQGRPLLFSIPLEKQSSFAKIYEVETSKLLYDKWKVSFLKTIENNYKKAPFYTPVYNLIDATLNCSEGKKRVSEIALLSMQHVLTYLGIHQNIQCSNGMYQNTNLTSEARVIDICKKEHATVYINPIGGLDLYSAAAFRDQGLDLKFIKPKLAQYKQLNNEFIPGLSIIDVLMFNPVNTVKEMLNDYELI